MLILFVSPIEVFNIRLETITMFYSSLMLLLGGQSIQFSLFTNIYGRCIGQFPKDSRLLMKIDTFIEKRGFMVAGLFIIVGGIGVALSIIMWGKIGFGELLSHDLHRWSILFGTVLFFGIHLLLSSFFVNVLHMGERE